MPTLSPLKKTLIASAFITPLVLGACSSGSEETTEAQDSKTTTTAAEQSAAAEESAVEGETADVESEAAAEEGADDAAANAPAANESAANEPAANESAETPNTGGAGPTAAGDSIDPAAAAVDPLSENSPVERAELAPVENGRPANAADRAEIEQLVTGMYDATTLHGILGYLPANTCSKVIQENGGEAAFDLGGVPDMPLEAVPQYANSNPRIDAVENIQVQGNTASATVTATSNEQSDTSVHRFRQEDGAWKFCD